MLKRSNARFIWQLNKLIKPIWRIRFPLSAPFTMPANGYIQPFAGSCYFSETGLVRYLSAIRKITADKVITLLRQQLV